MNAILFLPFPKGSHFQINFGVLNLQCSRSTNKTGLTCNQSIAHPWRFCKTVCVCVCVKCTYLKRKLFSSSVQFVFLLWLHLWQRNNTVTCTPSINQSWRGQKTQPNKTKQKSSRQFHCCTGCSPENNRCAIITTGHSFPFCQKESSSHQLRTPIYRTQKEVYTFPWLFHHNNRRWQRERTDRSEQAWRGESR